MKDKEVWVVRFVVYIELNRYVGFTCPKSERTRHDRPDIGELGPCHRERGASVTLLQGCTLKHNTGYVSFFTQLCPMGQAGITWFGPNGTHICLIRVPAHIRQAKGYPDIASRVFLRQIADQAPHVPMYALVDLDPDGIAIMSTYKYSSYRLAHEDVALKDTPGLSLPNIQWLGVKRHHVSRTPVGEGDTETSAMPELQGLVKLTARDRTKAVRMLEWDLCAEGGPENGWRHELQTMLMLNTKAEMQILDELPGGLVSWTSGVLGTACEQSLELLADSPGSDDGMLF
jgi:hypothetical protein